MPEQQPRTTEVPVSVSQTADPVAEGPTGPVGVQDVRGAYSRNVAFSLLKMAVVAASGVLLQSFLTRHLPTLIYGAWVLILQIAGYISYLDLGIQSALAKYIAQDTAENNLDLRDRHASAGVAITCASGMAGILLTISLTLLIPVVFRNMPAALIYDIRIGVLFIGISTAVFLACSPFLSFFLGLQRYFIPTAIQTANKLVYVGLAVVLVWHHCTLTTLGAAVAALNVATAIFEIVAWRMLLPIQIRWSLVNWPVVKQIVGYCGVLGIWTTGMLVITGLDTTIVAHYDFRATAFYAVAAMPITFMSLMLQAALNPLLPAVSALSVNRTAAELGKLLSRSTRIVVFALAVFGLPLILFGFYILKIWAGLTYAENGLQLMRILVLAHMIRNICGPYATMVVAAGKLKDATLSGICEAVINLVTSVVLGKYFGAIGVAEGTLIGAIVGVLIHFTVSMSRTQKTFAISPYRLFRTGIARPLLTLLPTLVLLPYFWKPEVVRFSFWAALIWGMSTFALGWRLVLTACEREQIWGKLRLLLRIRNHG